MSQDGPLLTFRTWSAPTGPDATQSFVAVIERSNSDNSACLTAKRLRGSRSDCEAALPLGRHGCPRGFVEARGGICTILSWG
jgi:hypothetical protein